MFRECQIVLESNLLHLDQHLSRPLQDVQDICLAISNVDIMDLGFTSPAKLTEFNKKQEMFRVTYLEKKIQSYEDTTKRILLESCNTSL